MRRALWFMAASSGLALVLAACSSDTLSCFCGGVMFDAGPDTGTPPPLFPVSDAGDADADAAPVVHTIAISVTTPSSTFVHGGPTNATWAARLDDETHTWVPMAPGFAVGEYVITTTAPSFSVAFACADAQTSLVTVLTQASDGISWPVELGPQCATQNTQTTDLTLQVTNAPVDTAWLDFGYAFDARGAVFHTNAGDGDDEIDNVVMGTWDAIYGVRDDGFSPLSKLAIVRNQVFAPTTTALDLDFEAMGFAPGAKNLASLHQLANDDVHVEVLYTLGGSTNGIDLGPGTDVDGMTDATIAYATIPIAQQTATDRYRASFIAQKDAHSTRSAIATFHNAIDFGVDFLPAVEPPVGMTMKPTPSAGWYELSIFSKVSNASSREWRVSIGALLVPNGSASIDLTPPDLSKVPGYDPSWNTPAGITRTISGTARASSFSVGDIALDLSASASVDVGP